MVRNLIRNQAPRKGLRVRLPCPPLKQGVCAGPGAELAESPRVFAPSHDLPSPQAAPDRRSSQAARSHRHQPVGRPLACHPP
jgi:hypothetical protein